MYTTNYRPFKFDDMIGQSGIIGEMKKRSKSLNFADVMIFEGETGSGKTTLAFIISAILNCKNLNEDFSSCGKCSSCKSIRSEKFLGDTRFYDASNMGKDDVLELEGVVNSSPLFDKNKIIIIDEAQELSKAGKGATLKLLERKRKNVYFILCTMDGSTINNAVKSRGQVYKFRKIDSFKIAEYLIEILKKENLFEDVPENFLEQGVFTIAENSSGSVRTALQNLERCVNGHFFSEKEIMDEFGFIGEARLLDTLISLLKKESNVIEEIRTYEIKDFFYKALSTLVDAYIFNVTGTCDRDWKEKYLKKLAHFSEELLELTKLFNDINEDVYFKKTKFFFKIAEYLDKNPIPLLEKSEERKAKRLSE